MADKTGVVQALLSIGDGQPGGGRPSGNMTVPYLAIVRYQMRGWHSGLGAWVIWPATGNPDTTGAGSGYPGVLTDIAWTAVRYGAV